jgi:hypothetical protein
MGIDLDEGGAWRIPDAAEQHKEPSALAQQGEWCRED